MRWTLAFPRVVSNLSLIEAFLILCSVDGGLAASVPPTPASVALPYLPLTSSVTTGSGEEPSPVSEGAGDDGLTDPPAGPTPPNPLTPEGQAAGETETEMEGETEAEIETEEEKARRLLYCSLCKVAVNSPSQLEAHNSGKHPMHPLLSPLHSLDTA